jgi:hypothetical protein
MFILVLIQTAAAAVMFVLTATHKKQELLAVKFTMIL